MTTTSPGAFEVKISWLSSNDDFDLWVYKGRLLKDQSPPSGSVAGSSTSVLPGTRELATVANLEPGDYTIRVIYRRVVQSGYRGAASFVGAPTQNQLGERGAYKTLNDDFFSRQWGLDQIDAPSAWQERNATGHGITIGIVDSGVDLAHPDLNCPGKLLVLDGATIGSNLPPKDTDGHGTHVAGIAAACTNNDTGVAGVAPDATIMPVNVIDAMMASDITPGGSDAAMAAGIEFATKNGAHVINLSIGPPPQEGSHFPEFYPETQRVLEEAHRAGVVVVGASGNTASPVCQYPSLSQFVICVGATDANGQKAAYSDFPNNLDRDGNAYASVLAPGGDLVPSTTDICAARILSTYLQGEATSCAPATGSSGDGYNGLAGTSMASPHVAGVAALVYDRLGGERSKDNAAAVIAAIIQSAKDMYVTGHDPLSGYGRVDALAAVLKIKVAEPPPPPAPSALSLVVEGNGSSRHQLVATLTDAASAAPLAGEPIEFFVDGAALGVVTTDGSGVARLPLEGRNRGARKYFEAVFRGSSGYQGSWASAQT